MAAALPTVNITPKKWAKPTGFEAQTAEALMRQKLAETMLGQALTQHDDYKSWLQPVAQIFQAWAGKSMEKDATKQQADILAQQTAAYRDSQAELAKDLQGGMSSTELWSKYGSNPLLEEDLKPVVAGITRQQQQNNTWMMDGPYHVRGSDLQSGQMKAPDYQSDTLVPDEAGQNLVLNGPAIAGKVAAQGLPLADEKGTPLYQTSRPLPSYDSIRQAMQSQLAPQGSQQILEGARQEGRAIRGATTAAPIYDHATGRTYYNINGRIFDNPEGK